MDTYACVGIIDWLPGGAAVETISLQKRGNSLSGSSGQQGVISLSGAWLLDLEQIREVPELLTNSLVLEIGSKSRNHPKLDPSAKTVDIQSFLASANKECLVALNEYIQFKNEKPGKRVKLVEPDFTLWPDSLNLEEASLHLAEVGRLSSILGTPQEMERILSAARLVKWLIEGWLHDEQERKQRSYISSSKPEIRILPPPWLQALFGEK